MAGMVVVVVVVLIAKQPKTAKPHQEKEDTVCNVLDICFYQRNLVLLRARPFPKLVCLSPRFFPVCVAHLHSLSTGRT